LVTDEEIRRLEQVWLVLSDFFQDLNRRNISVGVASELRNCKTLIHFIRTSLIHPSSDSMTISNSLQILQRILGKIQSDMISAAMTVDEDYVRNWTSKIDQAERAELNYVMIYTPSEFVPDLPGDIEKRWVRLTLPRPLAEERVQDIAEEFGVIIELKDESRIIISGRRVSVRKAAKDIYELSLE